MLASLFSLQPTFTQGFILGQLSILILLALILKYLFWNSGPEPHVISLPPLTQRQSGVQHKQAYDPSQHGAEEGESMEWLNRLLLQIIQSYRLQLRGYLPGSEGDEIVRRKIEAGLNAARPSHFTDPIRVHSVNLGNFAPRLSQAQCGQADSTIPNTKCRVLYEDSLSISLSTSIVLNYPQPCFAKLPVAITLSLATFSSDVTVSHPDPNSSDPSLSFTLLPDFTLDLHTNSLLGSRAKLADVPKVHEMIQSQIRHFLLQRGKWTVLLPHLDRQ